MNYYITIIQDLIFLFKYKEQIKKIPELSFRDCNVKGEPKAIEAMPEQKQPFPVGSAAGESRLTVFVTQLCDIYLEY